MGTIIDVGFDLVATRDRLDAWCIEHFACPIGSPGGSRELARTLLELHWGEHGVPTVVECNGRWVPSPRCTEPLCPVLGVALARLEIHWFGITLLESEQLDRLDAATSQLPQDDARRAEYLRQGTELAGHLVSQAAVFQYFHHATGGRPQLPLAFAVAQHLRCGGFPHAEIGKPMGCTPEAARKRCSGASRRSLGAFVEGHRVEASHASGGGGR